MADTLLKTGLSRQTIASIQSVFESSPLIEQVVLYGSRAKGNYRPGSDIDLTIKSSAMTLSDLLKLETLLDDLLLPYKIDLSLHHQIDNQALLEHIERVGLVFYP